MKQYIITLLLVCIIVSAHSQSCITVSTECNGTTDYCGPYELSNGIYRIPFANGTAVTISNDHFNHCPRGRIDMVGDNSDLIAAAADGWIRAIVDNFTTHACDCSTDPNCHNNYVWIEHQNGEWTKYTHFLNSSVTSLGHTIGEWVTSGTILGLESDIGCASGVHLHFEVAQPVDTNTLVFSVDGGFIDGDWAKNVIPVICSITNNVFAAGASYTAAACGICSASLTNTIDILGTGGYDVDIATTTITASNGVTYNGNSSVLFQAGTSVTFTPEFAALSGTTLTARIGACNAFPQKLASENEDAFFLTSAVNSLLKFYPNPADQSVLFEVKRLEEDSEMHFSIIDVSGRTVIQWHQDEAQDSYSRTIILNEFPSGIYICVLKTNGNLLTEKLVIQH